MKNHFGLFEQAVELRDYKSRRASSWDRTGGNADWILLAPGRRHTLLDEQGAGCLKRFYWTYITYDEKTRLNIFRGLVLRAWWDGNDTPSIEVPLGDFFGVTNGLVRPMHSLAFNTCTGHNPHNQGSWGFNCHLPMPFAEGARVELENQGDTEARIWFHIDYEVFPSAAISADTGRLHARWNRWNTTTAVPHPAGMKTEQVPHLSGDGNYVILDADGDGQFAGYFLSVFNFERHWWGEGDDMIFIDGEPFPPSIHGTGTEEIFGGGASPRREYCAPYMGFHCVENRGGYDYWGNNGMYRFYILDPIRFRRSIRVTLEHGHANDKANDYTSVAFWYQRGVNAKAPPLPPPDTRKVTWG